MGIGVFLRPTGSPVRAGLLRHLMSVMGPPVFLVVSVETIREHIGRLHIVHISLIKGTDISLVDTIDENDLHKLDPGGPVITGGIQYAVRNDIIWNRHLQAHLGRCTIDRNLTLDKQTAVSDIESDQVAPLHDELVLFLAARLVETVGIVTRLDHRRAKGGVGLRRPIVPEKRNPVTAGRRPEVDDHVGLAFGTIVQAAAENGLQESPVINTLDPVITNLYIIARIGDKSVLKRGGGTALRPLGEEEEVQGPDHILVHLRLAALRKALREIRLGIRISGGDID